MEQNISSQLKKISDLKDGWYDGYGKSFDPNLISDINRLFNNHFPANWRLPSIFPQENGEVSFEWNTKEYAISIDWGTEKASFFKMDKILDESQLIDDIILSNTDQSFNEMIKFISFFLNRNIK